MQLRFDTSKTYALALEGGGARGAYQIGAWRALAENGVKFNAVAGSSVGALNGALMTMGDLDAAEALWNDMRFSKVMDVDDSVMSKFIKGKILEIDLKNTKLKQIIKDGGFNVTPLKSLINEMVDPIKIRNSDVEFFICTHSLSDRKALELNAKDLLDTELCDMLLASAYFPAFKHEKLGGKLYTDGGVSNVLPISPLIMGGYKNIIAIRLYGFGLQKRVKIPKNTTVYEIAPTRDLGNMLNFDADSCKKNYKLGYFDTLRMLYGLYGERYYIDRTLTEKDAFEILGKIVNERAEVDLSLRQFHTEVLKFSKNSGSKGDYYDVLVAFMEKSAQKLKIDEFKVYSDIELLEKIGVNKEEHCE